MSLSAPNGSLIGEFSLYKNMTRPLRRVIFLYGIKQIDYVQQLPNGIEHDTDAGQLMLLVL